MKSDKIINILDAKNISRKRKKRQKSKSTIKKTQSYINKVMYVFIGVAMFEKMRYNIYWIMPLVESTFSGQIQKAYSTHLGVVTSGCDRDGSTTF